MKKTKPVLIECHSTTLTPKKPTRKQLIYVKDRWWTHSSKAFVIYQATSVDATPLGAFARLVLGFGRPLACLQTCLHP